MSFEGQCQALLQVFVLHSRCSTNTWKHCSTPSTVPLAWPGLWTSASLALKWVGSWYHHIRHTQRLCYNGQDLVLAAFKQLTIAFVTQQYSTQGSCLAWFTKLQQSLRNTGISTEQTWRKTKSNYRLTMQLQLRHITVHWSLFITREIRRPPPYPTPGVCTLRAVQTRLKLLLSACPVCAPYPATQNSAIQNFGLKVTVFKAKQNVCLQLHFFPHVVNKKMKQTNPNHNCY